MSYELSAFKPEVQKIIKENGNYFDRNQSGAIEKDEIPLLIFCTNAEDETELLANNQACKNKKMSNILKGTLTTGLSGIATYNGAKILCSKGNLLQKILGGIFTIGGSILMGRGLRRIANATEEKTIKIERYGIPPELLPPKTNDTIPPDTNIEKTTKLLDEIKTLIKDGQMTPAEALEYIDNMKE